MIWFMFSKYQGRRRDGSEKAGEEWRPGSQIRAFSVPRQKGTMELVPVMELELTGFGDRWAKKYEIKKQTSKQKSNTYT